MLPECDICNKSNLILCSQEMPNVEISQGDLYAPLLLLILLSSLLCSLLACSCSRLSSRWWIARWSLLRALIQQLYDQDDGELQPQLIAILGIWPVQRKNWREVKIPSRLKLLLGEQLITSISFNTTFNNFNTVTTNDYRQEQQPSTCQV